MKSGGRSIAKPQASERRSGDDSASADCAIIFSQLSRPVWSLKPVIGF